jgi:hypothetical protein
MELVCDIEIIKDGIEYIVRVRLTSGLIREYRHHVLEDVLTEMVISLFILCFNKKRNNI